MVTYLVSLAQQAIYKIICTLLRNECNSDFLLSLANLTDWPKDRKVDVKTSRLPEHEQAAVPYCCGVSMKFVHHVRRLLCAVVRVTIDHLIMVSVLINHQHQPSFVVAKA